MIELKPCPFCGGKAEIDYDDFDHYWICCASCGVTSDTEHCDHESAEVKLKKKWNTRPHENKIKTEAVREAINSCIYGDDVMCGELEDYANKLERGEV